MRFRPVFQKLELNAPRSPVDACNAHADRFAEVERALGPAQEKALFDKFIAVVGKRFNGHESLDGIRKFREDAEGGDARDRCDIFLSDLVLHIGYGIKGIHVPLRLGGVLFACRRLHRRFRNKFFVLFPRLFGRKKTFFDDAVDAQVGIAADGGSKVTVAFRSKPEMPDVFGE